MLRKFIFALFVAIAAGAMLLAALNPPTGKSRKAGIFPALDIFRWAERSWWGPLAAAGIMILGDFVTIIFLQWAVEGRFHVPQYWTFRFNDTLSIPLIIAGTAWLLRHWRPRHAPYTNHWYHAALLLGGFALSIFLESGAVKSGVYTMSQELSPSKLWHTFIFGVVAYWMVAAIVPALLSHRPTIAIVIFAVGWVGFGSMVALDTLKPMVPSTAHEHLVFDWGTGRTSTRK